MSRDIPKNKELLIVSDTGMFKRNGEVKAFGPVVKEVQYFLQEFDSITWIGYSRPDQMHNQAYLTVDQKKVNIIMLPRIGGKTLSSKIKILLQYPKMLFLILKLLRTKKYVHVRAPSHPAILTMGLSYFFKKNQFWFKYAGSWVDKASRYYEFQRSFLKKLGNNAKITVNGNWPSKNKNILAFENPCIHEKDRKEGKKILANKNLTKKIDYCFVGALNEDKGVHLILEALAEIGKNEKMGTFHFIGDGPKRKEFEEKAKRISVNCIFHGYMKKEEINDLYSQCHFVILPSKSEGFPKVIGEGMNFGCVPLVTNVSAIGQYVAHKRNGFLIQERTSEGVKETILESAHVEDDMYKNMQKMNYQIAEKFTYAYYIKRMTEELFNTNV